MENSNSPLRHIPHVKHLTGIRDYGSASESIFLEYRFIGAVWKSGSGFRVYSPHSPYNNGLESLPSENEAHEHLIEEYEYGKQEGRGGRVCPLPDSKAERNRLDQTEVTK